MAFKIPYVYDYITKLRRTQAEVILNHVNPKYVVLDKEKPCIRSTEGFNLAAVRPTTDQLTAVSEWLNKLKHNLLHKPTLIENLCRSRINVT
jgi:hypothetical protein